MVTMTAADITHPVKAPKKISVLGSTGTIGRNTLDLVDREREEFEVVALTANANVDLLIEQARRLRPHLAVIGDESHYPILKEALAGTGVEVAAGDAAVCDAAAADSDWVMAGIVGAAGLAPTLAAVRRGAVVALANKECLVCAGDLFMKEVARCGATLLPVDSEHNAIFQVFDFAHPETVESITLTASGGPFRTFSRAAMADVTPEAAVCHPNWQMGAKISVDSATMMNKGLELVEAAYLFPVPAERIGILVHPQSIIHGLVSYRDGSVLAQMGSPDMRTPIAVALGWPDRQAAPAARLDLAAITQLTFEQPDTERFPLVALAREALQRGGSAPTLLNAANEVAVESFLAKRIGFLDIAHVVQHTLAGAEVTALDHLEDVFAADRHGRERATHVIEAIAGGGGDPT